MPAMPASINTLGFQVVDQHVARNAVSRSISRARLQQAARDCQIELYLLPDGADVTALVLASSKTLAVALGVLTDTHRLDTPDARIIAGGMSCLAQCSERRFTWRSIDARAVDEALKHAVAVYTRATARQVEEAYLRVGRLERQAAAAQQQPATSATP